MSIPFLKLALIGDPVAHSKSPELHTHFLAEGRRAGRYEAIVVPAGQSAQWLPQLHAAGYLGLNVTTPLKEEVLTELVSWDDLVRSIGAANTLIATPSGWHGANTDALGICEALRALLPSSQSLAGLHVLVLGTGPTGRAALMGLSLAGASVCVWSRRAERAQVIADALGVQMWHAHMSVDAIVATLPPHPHLPAGLCQLLQETPLLLDANYGPRATLHELVGRPVADGFTMLKAQAWASYRRWIETFGEGEI